MKENDMLASAVDKTLAIARLNDRALFGYDRTAKVTITSTSLAHLCDATFAGRIQAQAAPLEAVRSCSYSKDSPMGDMAFIKISGLRAQFRIDYNDLISRLVQRTRPTQR